MGSGIKMKEQIIANLINKHDLHKLTRDARIFYKQIKATPRVIRLKTKHINFSKRMYKEYTLLFTDGKVVPMNTTTTFQPKTSQVIQEALLTDYTHAIFIKEIVLNNKKTTYVGFFVDEEKIKN